VLICVRNKLAYAQKRPTFALWPCLFATPDWCPMPSGWKTRRCDWMLPSSQNRAAPPPSPPGLLPLPLCIVHVWISQTTTKQAACTVPKRRVKLRQRKDIQPVAPERTRRGAKGGRQRRPLACEAKDVFLTTKIELSHHSWSCQCSAHLPKKCVSSTWPAAMQRISSAQ
jgi:hypothetical protein